MFSVNISRKYILGVGLMFLLIVCTIPFYFQKPTKENSSFITKLFSKKDDPLHSSDKSSDVTSKGLVKDLFHSEDPKKSEELIKLRQELSDISKEFDENIKDEKARANLQKKYLEVTQRYNALVLEVIKAKKSDLPAKK